MIRSKDWGHDYGLSHEQLVQQLMLRLSRESLGLTWQQKEPLAAVQKECSAMTKPLGLLIECLQSLRLDQPPSFGHLQLEPLPNQQPFFVARIQAPTNCCFVVTLTLQPFCAEPLVGQSFVAAMQLTALAAAEPK
jgi:hypothetical protein